MSKQKQGIASCLMEKSLSSLYVYLLICAGALAVVLGNLAVQGVGLRALTGGTEEERNLFLLTFAIATVCAAAIACLGQAIGEKKRRRRESKKG